MFAIRCGTTFDGEQRLPAATAVLVEDGRIAGVGEAVPADCEVVDLPAATLLPGLVDAHVHLCGDGTDGTLERLEAVDDGVLRDTIERGLRQQLAAGVTTVRDLGDRRYAVVDWNARRRAGDGLPTVVAAGPPITSVGGHCANMGGEAAGIAGLQAAVREHAARGVDVIKIMGSGGFMTTGTDVQRCQFDLDELRAAVDEAHRLGLPVTVHAHPAPAVRQAVDAGADGIGHGTCISPEGPNPPAADVRRLAAAGMPVCVTAGVVGIPRPTAAGRALLEHSPIGMDRVIELLKRLAATYFDGGVRVVAGGDSGISESKPHGLLPVTVRWYVEGGMRAADALAAATSVAADVCGLGGRKGRIRLGCDADLLVVGGDALTDVSALGRPLAVYLGGRQSWAMSDQPATSEGLRGAGPM
jgi:imidazolonepropionase-like amidohydrolase